MGLGALVDYRAAQAILDHGVETTADITSIRTSSDRGGNISYSVGLAWRDQSGSERHYGPTHVSELYARWLRSNDASVVGQTTIKYLEENRWARPIIVVDNREREFQDLFGLIAAGITSFVGLLLGAVLVLRTRLAFRRAQEFPGATSCRTSLGTTGVAARAPVMTINTESIDRGAAQLRIHARNFFGAEIAYSIGYFLYHFGGLVFIQTPVLALEIASYLIFLSFTACAFQRLPFKWLWVVLAFVITFGIPAAISLVVTTELTEVAAPDFWFWATSLAISLIKLAVAGCIYVWSINREGRSAPQF